MRSRFTKTGLLSVTVFLLVAGSLTASLFFRDNLLWMDEILSYLLISDPSLAHLNDAIVSGLDANPPLFINLYWFIAHTSSLNIIFLKSVSVALFATTLALFYHYTTRLMGKPTLNFVLVTGLAALTYLNITLATQIRTYTLFLLVSFIYITLLHRLVSQPANTRLLIGHTGIGLLLTLTHNFGLFYVAAAGIFFGLLWVWSKDGRYGYVLSTFGFILVLWLLIWYPNFAIQAKAGQPHSWIPRPTLASFFETVGELAPVASVRLEKMSSLPIMAMLRFGLLVALFAGIVGTKLRTGLTTALTDSAFALYLLSVFLYAVTITIALIVSELHTSVFISRYLWPNHLLVIYQLMYAVYYLAGNRFFSQWLRVTRRSLPADFGRLNWVLPVYTLSLAGLLFYRSQKKLLCPVEVVSCVAKLDKNYPVFLESSLYFLPAWYYNTNRPVNFLLDHQSAFDPGNKDLSATVSFHTLASVKEKYKVDAVIPLADFNASRVGHFFVIDERRNYQIERFIRNRSVKVVRVGPTILPGVTILECVFNDPSTANRVGYLPAGNRPLAKRFR